MQNRSLRSRVFFAVLAACAFAFLGGVQAYAEDIKILTVDSPPLVMHGKMHGILGDLTLEALRRLGYTGRLVFEPWVRSQIEAAKGTNVLIIPLTRTADREQNFLWIYNELDLSRVFVTNGESIASYAQARSKLHSISVLNGSVNHTLLKEEGFSSSQIHPVNDNLAGLRMLLAGRVDAWFNSDFEARWMMKGQDSAEKLTLSSKLSPGAVYVAASKNCDPRLVEGLRRVLAEMKQDGTYEKILRHYE